MDASLQSSVYREVRRRDTRRADLCLTQLCSVPTCRSLIECGANIEAREPSGKTPIMLAAAYRRPSVVEYLLSSGADATACTDYGKSALEIATDSGDADVISQLELALGMTVLDGAESMADSSILTDTGVDTPVVSTPERSPRPPVDSGEASIETEQRTLVDGAAVLERTGDSGTQMRVDGSSGANGGSGSGVDLRGALPTTESIHTLTTPPKLSAARVVPADDEASSARGSGSEPEGETASMVDGVDDDSLPQATPATPTTISAGCGDDQPHSSRDWEKMVANSEEVSGEARTAPKLETQAATEVGVTSIVAAREGAAPDSEAADDRNTPTAASSPSWDGAESGGAPEPGHRLSSRDPSPTSMPAMLSDPEGLSASGVVVLEVATSDSDIHQFGTDASSGTASTPTRPEPVHAKQASPLTTTVDGGEFGETREIAGSGVREGQSVRSETAQVDGVSAAPSVAQRPVSHPTSLPGKPAEERDVQRDQQRGDSGGCCAIS